MPKDKAGQASRNRKKRFRRDGLSQSAYDSASGMVADDATDGGPTASPGFRILKKTSGGMP
jgi:hypothetical protein